MLICMHADTPLTNQFVALWFRDTEYRQPNGSKNTNTTKQLSISERLLTNWKEHRAPLPETWTKHQIPTRPLNAA